MSGGNADKRRLNRIEVITSVTAVVVIFMLLKSKINIKFYKIFMFTMAGAFVIVYLYRMFIGTGDIVVFEPQNNILFRIIRKLNL